MTDLVRRSTLERTWKCWAGEIQDLRRVVSLVEDLATRRKSQALSELTDKNDKYEREEWENRVHLVIVEIADGADSITGPSDEVFKELDRRTVMSIKISTDLPSREDKLNVSFKKKGYRAGVDVEVKSLDPGWARQAMSQLSDEIDKSEPKWSFFLSNGGMLFSLFMSYITVVGVADLIEARLIHRDLAGWLGATFFIAFSSLLFMVLLGSAIWPWMFPKFELYGEGGSSTGGRRLAGLLVFFGSIAAGVLVNLIT
jgi:hypothetical protein